MVKEESGSTFWRELLPMDERRLEQHAGPFDIGLDEFRRAVDRTVDMGFCREVENGIGVELPQQRKHRLPITNISPAKRVSRARLDWPQRPQVRRIGQLINVKNRGVQLADKQPTDRRPDKARTTRHQYLHHRPPCLRVGAGYADPRGSSNIVGTIRRLMSVTKLEQRRVAAYAGEKRLGSRSSAVGACPPSISGKGECRNGIPFPRRWTRSGHQQFALSAWRSR